MQLLKNLSPEIEGKTDGVRLISEALDDGLKRIKLVVTPCAYVYLSWLSLQGKLSTLIPIVNNCPVCKPLVNIPEECTKPKPRADPKIQIGSFFEYTACPNSVC